MTELLDSITTCSTFQFVTITGEWACTQCVHVYKGRAYIHTPSSIMYTHLPTYNFTVGL